MIQTISKIQKIASGNQSGVVLNASLPISIKVLEKTGYNRYNLKFKNKTLSTKSMKQLKIGKEYWGEIGAGSENIIIQNLYEKPNFSPLYTLENGLELVEKIINEPNLKWFYDYIFLKLTEESSKEKFEIYTDMLFALQKDIIHIPFAYGENLGIFQMKKELKASSVYLVFGNFAPLIFEFKNSQISSITTPFNKVAKLLNEKFECEIRLGSVSEIYTPNGKIIDFKG